MKLSPAKSIRGSVTVPGDKSISHRSVMLGSIARGTTEIHGFLEGADCLSTISCFRHMGVDIENKNGVVTVHGKGLHGLSAPSVPLDCGKQRHHHPAHFRDPGSPGLFCPFSPATPPSRSGPWAGSSPLFP